MEVLIEEKLRTLRRKKGINQEQLARALNVTPGAIGMWETGRRSPDIEMINKLADYFNVTVDYILGREPNPDIVPYQFDRNVVKINVYGKIPAGIPVEFCEDIIDDEEIPADWLRGGKVYFGLKIEGNSMLPEFKNGDTLIFRVAPKCENGQYCAVTVNGHDATFKKVIKRENGITLQPLNHEFEPMFFTSEEINELPVSILGVLREVRRSYK